MNDKVAAKPAEPEMERVEVIVKRKTYHLKQLMPVGTKTYVMIPKGGELPAVFERNNKAKAEEAPAKEAKK
jgi:hypothetical protein